MDQQVQQPDTWRNISAVFGYLILGLLVTASTVITCCRMGFLVGFVRNHFIVTMILTCLLMTASLSLFNRMPYPEKKYKKLIVWLLICVFAGIPLVDAAPGVLLTSAIYTAALVVLLSASYFFIPFNIVNSFIYPMTVLHTAVMLCTVYSIVFGITDSSFSQVVTAFCLHGGLLVYSILLVCNTQRLTLSAKYSRFDPIFSAVVIFMNIINLFSRVATFCSIEVNIIDPKI